MTLPDRSQKEPGPGSCVNHSVYWGPLGALCPLSDLFSGCPVIKSQGPGSGRHRRQGRHLPAALCRASSEFWGLVFIETAALGSESLSERKAWRPASIFMQKYENYSAEAA